MEFKNKNVNRKSKNPMVWRPFKEIDWSSLTLDQKIELWKKESRERVKCLKTEFVSNREQTLQDIQETKDRKAREKKWSRGE